MAVQMIGREIQKDTDVRAKGIDQLQLKTAQLNDCDGLVVCFLHAGNERRADVPGKNGGEPRIFQNVFDQRGGRSLPVGTCDADQASAQEAIGEFDLAPNGNALRTSCLQQRSIGGHAGTRNDQVLLDKSIFPMSPEFEAYPCLAKLVTLFTDFGFDASIRCHYGGAARGAKECCGHTGPGQSHDQHALVSQLTWIRHLGRENLFGYLNFKVVSANSAKTSAAIQNRTITFDSLQPSNSKW